MMVFCRAALVRASTIGMALTWLACHALHADERAAADGHTVRGVVAHRGSSLDRPENTVASALRAIEAGATALEVDARSTKDLELVVLHDDSLDRTTDGHGKVADQTLAQIRTLDAGSWFDPRYAGERVPTVAELLELCRGKIDALIDLKEQGQDYARRVAAVVREHGEPGRTILGVRSVEQARLFRELLPESRQLGLIPTRGDIEAFAAAGVEAIRLWPYWLDDEGLVERVRAAGVELHVSAGSGKEDEVRALLAIEVDQMSTDDTARLIETLTRLEVKVGGP